MNRDDVIRWMQEVGAKENNPTPQTYEGFVDIFKQFAALVAAHEREALKKYGRHLDGCALTLGGYQCTCGFNQQEVPR